MPAEGQPIDSRGGAPGNGPAYPRAGAPAHETDPSIAYNHSVGIARKDLSSYGSTWLVVRTNFPKGNLSRTS